MANNLDRIIKENFREPTRWLLKRLTGIQSVEILPLGTKMHRTIEKEADMFFRASPDDDEPCVVHLEWQSKNDRTMPGRMLLYHVLKFLELGLPVISFLIYIGQKRLTMADHLCHKLLNYRYRIVDLTSFDPEEFLSSDVPEEVMLAILAGTTRMEEKRDVVNKVLVKLQKLLIDDPALLSRKLMQFEMLGNLRNIQKIITEEEQKMAIAYNLKTDVRYNQGIEVGEQKGEKKGDKNARILTAVSMIKENEPFEKIVKFSRLSLAEIKRLKLSKEIASLKEVKNCSD